MKKLMFLVTVAFMSVAFASCGNKSDKSNSVSDSDSVLTDTASIDSVSEQTTQQISKDSAAVNDAAEAATSKGE